MHNQGGENAALVQLYLCVTLFIILHARSSTFCYESQEHSHVFQCYVHKRSCPMGLSRILCTPQGCPLCDEPE